MNPNKQVEVALRRVKEQIAMKQRRTGVLRLADALCFTYRISEGRDLVLLLQNDPRVRNNRDAVAAWIESQLENPGPLVTEQLLPILVDLMGRKLRSIYEGGSCD